MSSRDRETRMADKDKEKEKAVKRGFARPQRSQIWASFDLVVVDKVKYSVCKACGKQIKYFGGTTNMKLHARQHEEKPDGGNMGKSSSSKNAAGATLDGFVVRRSNPQRVCPVWKTNGANELVVRWLWRKIRPLDMVNDEGLQDLLRFFEPGYNLQSRTFVEAQLKMK